MPRACGDVPEKPSDEGLWLDMIPSSNPTSVADIDLLDRAKANLIRCHSVGLVERFGESLDVMSDAWAWDRLGHRCR